MGRPSNKAQRRAQIVEGLRQVMAQHGYTGATIGAIARAAGLAPGLVHYHFQSKREILVALTDWLAEQVRARFEAISASETDAHALVEAWISAHLALGPGADATSIACWVTIGAEAVRDPWVRDAYARVVAEDIQRVSQLLEDAGCPPHQAEIRGRTLLAAIEGYYRLATGAPGVVPPGSANEAVCAIYRGMVR